MKVVIKQSVSTKKVFRNLDALRLPWTLEKIWGKKIPPPICLSETDSFNVATSGWLAQQACLERIIPNSAKQFSPALDPFPNGQASWNI